jgi:transposase InsO family protein
VTRRKKVRTTVSDPSASRAPDLVIRQFAVEAPNTLLVADFTYVRTLAGFCYTAFVIDAYAGLIAGWECSTSKHTAFVEPAIAQAAAFRARQGNPLQNKAIHHSEAAEAAYGVGWSDLRSAWRLPGRAVAWDLPLTLGITARARAIDPLAAVQSVGQLSGS